MPLHAVAAAPPSGAVQARIAARMTPALFAETRQGQERFWEFFGGSLRNRNTRLAYVTAAYRFADWCAARGLTLSTVRPLHVAGYIEQLTRTYAAATVKQNLAALRQLFDWFGGRPGDPDQPGRCGTRPQTRGQDRQDPRVDRRRNPQSARPH